MGVIDKIDYTLHCKNCNTHSTITWIQKGSEFSWDIGKGWNQKRSGDIDSHQVIFDKSFDFPTIKSAVCTICNNELSWE